MEYFTIPRYSIQVWQCTTVPALTSHVIALTFGQWAGLPSAGVLGWPQSSPSADSGSPGTQNVECEILPSSLFPKAAWDCHHQKEELPAQIKQ